MTPSPPRQALIVDDEPDIVDLVCLHLTKASFKTVGVASGGQAVDAASRRPFDVVVLDVMLPDIDGLSVCRAIRQESVRSDVPILMITARRSQADVVAGLNSGADDYLPKPFGVGEMVARVQALVRRAEGRHAGILQKPQRLSVNGLELDHAKRQVWADGRLIQTTRLEFQLLYLLASQPGVVFSRQRLLQRVWPDDTFVTERSVDALVKRLRKKLEGSPDSTRWIRTAWGEGYKLADRP